MEQNNTNKILVWVTGALVIGAIGGYLIAGGTSSKSPVENKDSMSNSAPAANTATAGTNEWKIQNAISAALESISKDATVIDWPVGEGKDFAELRKGSNGWTCLPDYPATPGNDPICVDQMAFQWFGAYMSHKTPQIAQAGIGYMLQGGSDASNTDPYATEPKPGESWMSDPPHIMIFSTTPPDPKVYGTDPDSGKPWVMWANTPYAHLMIPVQK